MPGEQLPTPRRYNEKEVALLLRRASELQRAAPTVRDPTGLTLRELEEIASEAGLDSAMLRQAAAELDTGVHGAQGNLGSRLAGGPLRTVLERAVPGELPESGYAELIPLIIAAADRPGLASQVGQTFTWTSQDQANVRQLQVMMSSLGGSTQIRVEERYGGMAGGIFGVGLGGIGGGVGIGLGGGLGSALGSLALGLGIPAVTVGLSYLGCRTLYRHSVARRRQVLERLMRDLEDRVRLAAQRAPAALPPERSPSG